MPTSVSLVSVADSVSIPICDQTTRVNAYRFQDTHDVPALRRESIFLQLLEQTHNHIKDHAYLKNTTMLRYRGSVSGCSSQISWPSLMRSRDKHAMY
jgi:hypothetical protein